jgi:hypothetical protein
LHMPEPLSITNACTSSSAMVDQSRVIMSGKVATLEGDSRKTRLSLSVGKESNRIKP